ncbi:YihY/virulence factor BrkB family protein [Haloferacaceae archaeon DSL9]
MRVVPSTSLASDLWQTARERKVTLIAASVAYYAIASVVPLALLIFSVTALFGEEWLVERVLDAVDPLISAAGREVVDETLRDASGRVGASIVSILALLWGALKVFHGLSRAFGELYDNGAPVPLAKRLRDSALVLTLLIIAIGLLAVVDVLLVAAPLPSVLPFVSALRGVAVAVVLTVVFLPLYYVLPPVPVTIRGVLPGTAFAAIGWVLLRASFSFYALHAGQYRLYGVFGALLLFVTWIYLGSLLLLFGGVINVVVGDRRAAS